MNPLAAALVAAALAGAGRLLGWLTAGGAAAGAAVGAAICTGLGPRGAALLGLFFVSGSLLTALTLRRGVAHSDARSGARDARQVMANGGWAAVGALLSLSHAEPGWALAAGALASAQADTWATEIGAFAKRPPRLITTLRQVPRGTSGAVSGLGTLGGVVGAALLAVAAAAPGIGGPMAPAILAGGVIGMAGDSVLGATLQARFHCDRCAVLTERPTHLCGEKARHISGWRWLDNDGVNVVANGLGGVVSMTLVG